MTANATRSSAPDGPYGAVNQRSRRFRHLTTTALSLALVLVISTRVSMAPALMAPGTDSVGAALSGWGRDHYLGWAVTGLEQLQYARDKPRVSGSIAAGLPTTGSRSDSSSGTRPTPR